MSKVQMKEMTNSEMHKADRIKEAAILEWNGEHIYEIYDYENRSSCLYNIHNNDI